MDYHPNILASTLASKKTHTFSILFPKPVSVESYWNKPMIGVRNAFKDIQSYGINITPHFFNQFDVQSFKIELKQILQSNADGVVLAPFFSRESIEFTSELRKRNIPYVFIDSDLDDANKVGYIGQDSFQSGILSAKLLSYSTPIDSTILVVHFAKQLDNINHLVQREKGFYSYFVKNNIPSSHKIITLEIEDPTNPIFMKKLEYILLNNKSIRGIFVTNSQVYYVGRIIQKLNIKGIRIIGHDLINENVKYLNEDIIDFLVCQRPEEQGYQSIITLFDFLILNKDSKKDNFTSIDIISKENINYYK